MSKSFKVVFGAWLIVSVSLVVGITSLGRIGKPTLSPNDVLYAPPVERTEQNAPKNKQRTVILNKNNTVTLRDVVTYGSVGKLQDQLFKLSYDLSPTDHIYLVLDTPGGSVDAGLALISMAQGLPQKIHTITLSSYSMGFHIVQSLGQRLILPNGSMMSHRVKGGIQGELPGSAITRLNFIMKQIDEEDAKIAKRVKMSTEAYRALIQDEYWVSGSRAVDANMADEVVTARCGKDLSGTEKVSIFTLFGTINVTFSQCPLVQAPLSVDLSGLKFQSKTEESDFISYITSMLYNKKSFVNDYVVNERYKLFIHE